jgi:hypothetical protein
MRGTRMVLSLLALVFATNMPGSYAAEECLTKPNGPTPQGQHWYYRTERDNGGRQCWYLRAENARTQRAARPVVENSPEADNAATFGQRTAPVEAPENPSGKNTPVTVALAPWPGVAQPETVVFLPPAAQPKPEAPTEAAVPVGATSSAGAVTDEADSRTPPVARSQAAVATRPQEQRRAREPQRHRPSQPSESKPAPAIADIDHTFSVLMVLFAALAIAGPALHIVERRRRRREAVSFQPPPWARVVALNAPTPRIRVAPVAPAGPRAAPPEKSSDQTERLARALQQLVDRLQTAERREPKPVRIRPANRASI